MPPIPKKEALLIYFIIAALIVMLDQASKYFLSMQLSHGETVQLIPGIINMIYVENTGAAFSFLSDMRWVLVSVSAIAVVLLAILLIRYGSKMKLLGSLSLACVLGGAIGNLIDRALFGYVVDFFEFAFVRFAIFNVADIFITVGGIVFCLYYIFGRDELLKDFSWGGKKKEAQDVSADEPDNDTEENDDGSDPA